MLHVAVLDPPPVYRLGAATVLSAAGHQVDTPDDVLAWAASRHPVVVVLTLVDVADWELLVRLRDEPAAGVVALLQDVSPAAVRAVHLGARSVLARVASPAALRRTVEATADGQAVLPVGALTALAGAPHGDTRVLSEERLSWWRRCVVEPVDGVNSRRVRGQIAWASSVNAAATRVVGGASTASS